ncbi:hypothetical protein QMA56_01730 [Leuconostoc falkenbergense]|uniref:hypothetical protein n=1 Tax=Leuconostoc falkenbergense TaxID=2766470 RepID=UPI0024ADC78D|nr:hypothetical protein [Leuconostoc falkenbergense]MDI6666423.1 hypothetical protein [Leuconostoc falkenbergense]
MKDFSKQAGKGIFYGSIGGVIGLLILAICIKNNNFFGNVADWVSGIGSIGAIVIVYRQIKESQKQSADQIEESQKQLEKQLESSIERDFRVERPLFKIVRFTDVKKDALINEMSSFGLTYTGKFHYNYVINNLKEHKLYEFYNLKNISQKIMCGVKIELVYENDIFPKSDFFIDYIKGYSSVNVFDFMQDVDEKESFLEKSGRLQEIIVSFNTGIRELIVLKFSAGEDNSLVYNKDERYIENKHQNDKPKPDYNLNNFKESYSSKK